MAAWQSGTHGEAAGTLACAGPSVASSALRFAGRTGALTMTSGSPTSATALTSPADTAGKRPGGGGHKKKVTCSAPRAPSYLCHSIMTRGPPRKRKTNNKARWGVGKPETEGVHPALAIAGPFQTTERDS